METTGFVGMLAASAYLPIAIVIAAALSIALGILVVTHLLGPKRVGPIKQSTYESGMEPVGDTRRRFQVRFYLIAVLFLIFDVELLFLYPWAVVAADVRQGELSWAQSMIQSGFTPLVLLGVVGVFFVLLLVGFVYEWRRGVFKWS